MKVLVAGASGVWDHTRRARVTTLVVTSSCGRRRRHEPSVSHDVKIGELVTRTAPSGPGPHRVPRLRPDQPGRARCHVRSVPARGGRGDRSPAPAVRLRRSPAADRRGSRSPGRAASPTRARRSSPGRRASPGPGRPARRRTPQTAEPGWPCPRMVGQRDRTSPCTPPGARPRKRGRTRPAQRRHTAKLGVRERHPQDRGELVETSNPSGRESSQERRSGLAPRVCQVPPLLRGLPKTRSIFKDQRRKALLRAPKKVARSSTRTAST